MMVMVPLPSKIFFRGVATRTPLPIMYCKTNGIARSEALQCMWISSTTCLTLLTSTFTYIETELTKFAHIVRHLHVKMYFLSNEHARTMVKFSVTWIGFALTRGVPNFQKSVVCMSVRKTTWAGVCWQEWHFEPVSSPAKRKMNCRGWNHHIGCHRVVINRIMVPMMWQMGKTRARAVITKFKAAGVNVKNVPRSDCADLLTYEALEARGMTHKPLIYTWL